MFERGQIADGNSGTVTPRPGDPQYFDEQGNPRQQPHQGTDGQDEIPNDKNLQDYFQGADKPGQAIRSRAPERAMGNYTGWTKLGRRYYSDFGGILWRCEDPNEPSTCRALVSAEWVPNYELLKIISQRIHDGEDRPSPQKLYSHIGPQPLPEAEFKTLATNIWEQGGKDDRRTQKKASGRKTKRATRKAETSGDVQNISKTVRVGGAGIEPE